jgi:hypothetical protein
MSWTAAAEPVGGVPGVTSNGTGVGWLASEAE